MTEKGGNRKDGDVLASEFRRERMPEHMAREMEIEAGTEFLDEDVDFPLLHGVPVLGGKEMRGFRKSGIADGKVKAEDAFEPADEGKHPILSALAVTDEDGGFEEIDVGDREVYEFLKPDSGVKVKVNDGAVTDGKEIVSRIEGVRGVENQIHLLLGKELGKGLVHPPRRNPGKRVFLEESRADEPFAVDLKVLAVAVVRVGSPVPGKVVFREEPAEIAFVEGGKVGKGYEIAFGEGVEYRGIRPDGSRGTTLVDGLFDKELVDEWMGVLSHDRFKIGGEIKTGRAVSVC